MSEITQILRQIEQGNASSAEELLPIVYDELRKLAAQKMACEQPDHTLQATALVHEAYVRLMVADEVGGWDSRGHFFAAAAEAMRRILVEQARSKTRQKRGRDMLRVELTDLPEETGFLTPEQLLELDDLLEKLRKQDPCVAELVQLRLYAGLSVTEAASALGISRTETYENWDYALSWFTIELNPPEDP